MKPKFEIEPRTGIGPVKIGASRSAVAEAMGLKPHSFMKTPMSQHPTDAFYDAGFQVFYEGNEPQVESIELSRDCGFYATLSGVSILDIPAEEALSKIEEITGIKPQSEDDGYCYEIAELGLWVWRPSNESEEEDGLFFSTIGVGTPNT